MRAALRYVPDQEESRVQGTNLDKMVVGMESQASCRAGERDVDKQDICWWAVGSAQKADGGVSEGRRGPEFLN